jgi:polysaccharide biosynthesis protein PslF
MKVLIISAFPPEPAPEANHALHFSEQLAKAGHAVHVLCKKGSIAATQQNMIVHPIIENWSWSDLPRLVKYLKGCRPDVVLLLYIGWVYNHQPMITFLPTICKTILPGIPCVTQFEIVDTEFPRRSLRARALRKVMALWAGEMNVHWLFGTLLRDSARTIVLSSPHRDRLVKHYPEVAEKSVILPPSPLIRFCPDQPATVRRQVRDVIGATERDFVLIYWGYIYPGKGVETLLQAFRILCRRNENIRLILVGGSLEIPNHSCSDYFQMVQRLPEKLGIADKVTWTGSFNWDSDEGSRYLYAGDACVLPFDYGVTLNNSSLAAASTHGVPVISTELAVGRDEALAHGRNIYLCQPRNPEMLAEAIQLLNENAGLRERLRLGVLALARDWYRWETTTERLIGILESAIAGSKGPGREQSQSYVATNETKSRKKRISPEMDPHDYDDVLPGVQENNLRLSSLVLPGEHTPNNVNAPLISVIVAVYNVEKYLGQCLDSLVNQTLTNIEIIVVNDASTDNSAEIINSYKSSYLNLRVINCEFNKGLASVRNIGLRAANGRYIAFADGDDWVDIRMCEVLYQRASDDNADVLIADATVFFEDSKSFRPLFDQHIRQALDPRLRTMPFELRSEPRVLLLEPVAWTKLYKRSFLQKHALQFEEGMNSYEDICFHFSVLVKATRISLLDDVLFYYRQNRPGQISGRISRKIFEVFAVFQKIHENLAAWGAPTDIWAMLVKVQLRQFDWLMTDRVQASHKREFFALVVKQFGMIPEAAFRTFTPRPNSDELPKLFCMRRNWLFAYEQVARQRWPLFPWLDVLLRERWHGVLKRGGRHGWEMPRRRVISLVRSLVNKSFQLEGIENTFRTFKDRLNQLTSMQEFAIKSREPLVEACRVNNHILFLSRPVHSGIEDAIRRMQSDYYLTQTAVFREGDTVIDVGAHLGVVSIYLAKKFPFLKVYAIEPNPLSYACLKRNIELNGVTNITALHKALSEDGQARMLYTDARESGWATIDARMASSKRVLQTVQVETVTLEQLFQEYQISHCRLLKITALGAIHGSLTGFRRSACVDLLCGEVDLGDCSRVQLEMASWRIARQHFWRTIVRQANGTVHSWLQQIPTGIEQPQDRIEPTTRTTAQPVHSLTEP